MKNGHQIILNDYKERCEKRIHVLFSLAKTYEEGNEVEQDFEKAFQYYLKAAEFGHIGAIYNIGCLYENGEGVAQDYARSSEYYTQAAKNGNSDAACCLAGLYEKGLGVDRDDNSAFYWYMKAAQDRMPHALYKIGCMYREGRGVKQDVQQGMKYLRIAALTGYQLARNELKNIRLDSKNTNHNKETISQRIGLLVAESGLSPDHYALKIGYPKNRFKNVMDGIDDVDVLVLKCIRNTFPDVDLNWIIEGSCR